MIHEAACDDCSWEGDSPTDASRHHVKTGHNCHATVRTNYFYGDSMASWARNNGMTMSPPPTREELFTSG